MTPDVHIPWPTPKTDAELSGLMDVSRRRVYKMRQAGAPSGRDLVEWHTWLRQTARIGIAERIAKLLPAEIAPEAAGAAHHPAPRELHDPDLADKSPAEIEVYWRTRRSREQALAAEATRRKIDRELIDIADVRRVVATIAATTVATLSDSIWRAMRPHLDGLAMTHPDLLRSLRRQHDQAVIAVRTTLAAAIAREVRALTSLDAP